MLELNHQSFAEQIKGKTPALIDFWAPWCMPCRMLAPVLEELSDELDGRVDFAKLNIDEFPDLATKYGISSIPTLILFKDGNPVTQMVGVQPKGKMLDAINAYI